MPVATFLFSALACLLVALGGRRDGSPRLSAAAIVMLLALPLLSLLPNLAVLPAAAGPAVEAAAGPSWATVVWTAGSLGLLARLAGSLATLHRWRRRSERVGTWPTGGGRKAEIRRLDSLDGPVAAGILRPVIFVPAAWSHWSEEVRRVVLAHEGSHLVRRDPLWRTLGALACALHWFNPLVWWLVRRHALQAEYACDALVLRAGVEPRHYARLLCDFAEGRRTPPVPAPPMAGRSCLRSRVERLLAPPRAISPTLTTFLVLTTVLAALAVSLLRRADPAPSAPVPPEEVRIRLSADPFPGNP